MYILLSNSSQIIDSTNPFFRLIPYLSFLITIASSYRLAKFNLDNHETHFIGLPTPANALLIIFLPYLFEIDFLNNYTNLLENSLFLVIITLTSSYLLISKIEMPSLKFQGIFTNSVKKSNSFKHFFFIFSMVLIIVFNLSAFPIIIIGYILIGLFRIKF
jgi:CDP-diacylglycerol--serine O-phosphatidyltransferase